MGSNYILQKTEKSFCPICNSKVSLLIARIVKLGPAFFICFHCNYIAEVGKGPVTIPSSKKEKLENVKTN